MYYSVEESFRGGRKQPSIPLGSFLPTPMALHPEVIHKPIHVGSELENLRFRNPSETSCCSDHAFEMVDHRHGDVPLLFQAAQVSSDLPFAHIEELCEMTI